MSDFGFNGMSDEEFNKEFLRFLNMYQSGLESFMKKNLGSQNNSFFGSHPMNIEPFDMDSLRKILSQLNDDMGLEKGNPMVLLVLVLLVETNISIHLKVEYLNIEKNLRLIQ
jgi:hypothetical protein